MLYKPRKSALVRTLFLTMTILIVSLASLFIMSGNTRVKIILMTLMLLTAGIGLYHILLASTLEYRWTEDALYIEGFFGLLRVVIPVDSMIRYTRRITLISRSGLLGSITRKYYIGNIIVHDMGKMRLFITDSKASIYLSTLNGIFGISPDTTDDFCDHLDRMGVPMAESPDYLDTADRERARKKFFQILIGTGIGFVLAVAGPLILYNAGMLPPYLMTLDASTPNIIYTPARIFLRTHLRNSLFILVIMILSGFASRYFKRIDHYYYYRVLYLPASMVFLLIVFFLHTLFPILS